MTLRAKVNDFGEAKILYRFLANFTNKIFKKFFGLYQLSAKEL